jgi:hypothetical protein
MRRAKTGRTSSDELLEARFRNEREAPLRLAVMGRGGLRRSNGGGPWTRREQTSTSMVVGVSLSRPASGKTLMPVRARPNI